MRLLRVKRQIEGVRELVLHLLVVAFALRALIPTGYMPDFSALSNGVMKVVICTASGAKTLDLKLGDDPQPADHSGQPCSFAGVTAVTLPTIEIAAVEFPVATQARVNRPAQVMLPPVRAGPPVGSRGPPEIS